MSLGIHCSAQIRMLSPEIEITPETFFLSTKPDIIIYRHLRQIDIYHHQLDLRSTFHPNNQDSRSLHSRY